MISQLHIENFRSIEKATLDLGRITVLTGSNGSGKSSLMYSLLCLRNIVLFPHNSVHSIFNLQNILNLGEFKDVVYKKEDSRNIDINLVVKTDNIKISYGFLINPIDSWSNHTIYYPLFREFRERYNFNFQHYQSAPFTIKNDGNRGSGLIINSIPFFENIYIINSNHVEKPIDIRELEELNFHSLIEFVPTKRGFSKLSFGTIPLNYDIVTEDEIATKIALDIQLQYNISKYLEKIANRKLDVQSIHGTAIFYLKTIDVKTGLLIDLVNEGSGTNQIVTILAKALQPDKKFICIDEPEIHLHPSMIAKLVEALVDIAYTYDKQFMLSTHSEHFVTCLLAEVAKKSLAPDDLKVYYLTKEGINTNIEHQPVNEHGQIEGGLKNFYEAELKNLETFFNIA